MCERAWAKSFSSFNWNEINKIYMGKVLLLRKSDNSASFVGCQKGNKNQIKINFELKLLCSSQLIYGTLMGFS